MEKQKRKIYIYLIATILLACTAGWYSCRNVRNTRPEYAHQLLQKRFLKKNAQLKRYTRELSGTSIGNVHELLDFCRKNDIRSNEFAFYIYEDGQLTAWSSNVVQMPSETGIKTQQLNGFRQKERNRFFIHQQQNGRRHVIGAYMLESPYRQQKGTGIFNPQTEDIRVQNEKSAYPILDDEGHTAFYLNIDDCVHEPDLAALLELLLWMTAYTFLLLLLNSLSHRIAFLQRHPNVSCLILCLISLLLPFLCLLVKMPPALFTAKLFSSIYYSSAFKSLGGLFTGCYTLLIIAVLIAKKSGTAYRHPNRAVVLGNLSLVHLLYILSFAAFYRMILNASMQVLPSLPLRDSFHTGQHIFALKFIFAFSLSSVICAVQILLERCYAYCFDSLADRKKSIRTALLSAALVLAVYLILVIRWPGMHRHLFWYIGAIVYVCIIGFNIIHALLPKERFSIHYHALSCLLSVLLLSFLLEDTNNRRMLLSKESFATSILEKDDPLLQYSLNEVGNLLTADDTLRQMLLDSNVLPNEEIEYIREQYLIPYLDKYRKKIFLGRSSIPTDCIRIRRYQQMLSMAVDSSGGNGIAQMKAKQFGRIWYLMLKAIPLDGGNPAGDTAYIAVESFSGSDFFKPNYLLNRDVHRLEDEVHKLSCAEYVNGRLHAAQDMENAFRLDIRSYRLDTLYSGMTFRRGHNEYYVYYQHPEQLVMIATPQTLLKKSMAVFPYLFLLTLILCMLLSALMNYQYHIRYLLFRQRIQLLIVSMIFLTAVVGCVLFSFFSQKFSQNELYKSSHSRMDMLMQILPCGELSLDSSTTACLERRLLPVLFRIPNEYVENANIYTLKGEAVILPDKHLPIPQDMERLNPKVVENIYFQKKSFYRDTDIMQGRAQANILYKPLRNDRGEIVAYLSFPTRQRGGYMEQLVASILPTFLGIYLFISLLFAVFGSLMSKYLVASLTRVATYLSKVKLRSKNQKIQWKYEDEIGWLVKDYNRLVDDLEISAEQLARSERESAWKELAQQVAHEIKNPLTPMKLSTQQLQRRLHEGRLDEEQLEKYARMMIGQIDSLTEIASSFSSLAKIHQGNGQAENLLEIVKTAVTTFEDEEECHIELSHATPDNVPVWIDKEQLLRVFNNLIKNAIQAKKEDCRQHIEIKLYRETEKQWSVSITDYGKGMTEEEQKHAFSPHFTTKSAGSGLGLAIVRNILSDWGGSIRLESVPGEHTTFYLQLPEYVKA